MPRSRFLQNGSPANPRHAGTKPSLKRPDEVTVRIWVAVNLGRW